MELIVYSLIVGGFIWMLEQVKPGFELPTRNGWYRRAFALNCIQALIALIGAGAWDLWFSDFWLLNLGNHHIAIQAVAGYLTITFSNPTGARKSSGQRPFFAATASKFSSNGIEITDLDGISCRASLYSFLFIRAGAEVGVDNNVSGATGILDVFKLSGFNVSYAVDSSFNL